MSYQSLDFICFSALVLFFYYIAGKKCQRFVLLAANIAFFAISGVKYLPFIAVTTAVTFFAGMKIGYIYNKADEKLSAVKEMSEKKVIRANAKSKAKKVLIFSLIIAVGLLAVCKYTSFALKNINKVFSLFDVRQIPMFKMILPIGISFYTFMAISYVLDIYWKRYKFEKNFITYAVYLTYFPHVVQGPIDRFNEFKQQIENGISFNSENLAFGSQLAIWGFFKKLVIADRLGVFVDAVFKDWKHQDGLFIILSLLVYSIQIYCDFSGCIDIVTGISEMFGIKMRENFNHPYFSKNMAEFWRRWHISLQEWFKDYIYYPVSVSAFNKKIKKNLKAKNKARASELFATCFPILIVWLVTGIWHGANWSFVVWGLFHAFLLISGKIFEPTFTKINNRLHIKTESSEWKLWQMVRTYLLCCVGRIFFRADGITHALRLIKRMLLHTTFSSFWAYKPDSFGLKYSDINIMIVSVLVLLIVDILQEKMPLRKTLSEKNTVLRWAVIFTGLFAVLVFGVYGPGYDASSFIYEQF